MNIADKILDFFNDADKILWGPWTMIFIACVYVYFSSISGFFQLRKAGFLLRNTVGKIFSAGKSNKGLTPFQATSTALSSSVGMGSIAGVATALSVGGAGSIFWMWLLAILGMMTKTAEITLAVHYRDSDGKGKIHGGPMYYINKGLGWKHLALLFSFGIMINAFVCASPLQTHTVGRSFLSSYNTNPYLVAALMSATTAVVVIGGIRRIGKVCETLVPFMSILYILGGLIIFIVNYTMIPEVFKSIVKYAFEPMPAAGGFAGTMVLKTIQVGMSRGMLSNEAGIGTAPMAHAKAEVKHPFQQGMWGSFEVFFVTIIVCTMTAFTVLSTGVLSSGESGIELVLKAFSSVFSEKAAGVFISFSILTFCLSTQIGFYVYYETAVNNIFGARLLRYLRWFYFIPPLLFAGVDDVDKLWVFANIAVGVCAIPNLIALVVLGRAFAELMKDYLSGKNEYSTERSDVSRVYVRNVKMQITGNNTG